MMMKHLGDRPDFGKMEFGGEDVEAYNKWARETYGTQAKDTSRVEQMVLQTEVDTFPHPRNLVDELPNTEPTTVPSAHMSQAKLWSEGIEAEVLPALNFSEVVVPIVEPAVVAQPELYNFKPLYADPRQTVIPTIAPAVGQVIPVKTPKPKNYSRIIGYTPDGQRVRQAPRLSQPWHEEEDFVDLRLYKKPNKTVVGTPIFSPHVGPVRVSSVPAPRSEKTVRDLFIQPTRAQLRSSGEFEDPFDQSDALEAALGSSRNLEMDRRFTNPSDDWGFQGATVNNDGVESVVSGNMLEQGRLFDWGSLEEGKPVMINPVAPESTFLTDENFDQDLLRRQGFDVGQDLNMQNRIDVSNGLEENSDGSFTVTQDGTFDIPGGGSVSVSGGGRVVQSRGGGGISIRNGVTTIHPNGVVIQN